MIDVNGALNDLVEGIQERLKVKDKNCLIAITGQTGSGKSNVAITLANKIDPKFSIDNIVFDGEEFLNLLKGGGLKKGAAVVWDEAGVGLGAKEFMTMINRVLSTVTQTFRHMNLAVIFTLPYLSFLDKSTRILIHVNIETKAIYYKELECVCKWFNLQYNPRANKGQGKMYYHYPRIVRDGKVIVLEEIAFAHAPTVLWREYVKKSRSFKEDVRETALLTVRNAKRKVRGGDSKREKALIDKFANTVIKNPKKYMGTRGGGLNAYKIMVDFDINHKQGELVRAKAMLNLEEQGDI